MVAAAWSSTCLEPFIMISPKTTTAAATGTAAMSQRQYLLMGGGHGNDPAVLSRLISRCIDHHSVGDSDISSAAASSTEASFTSCLSSVSSCSSENCLFINRDLNTAVR